MGRKLQAFSRYRPRWLTVLAVSFTAALLVLSNLSYESRQQEGSVVFWHSYGWPLVWWRAVYADIIAGCQIRLTRLAIDAGYWLLILAAVGGVCEWLGRRYRPRLRWSLRRMLIGTAVAAACCGWFGVASRRARQQDEFIALFYHEGGWPGGQAVWIERWGPRWLELFGAQRYCRHVAGAEFTCHDGQWTQSTLNRLKEMSGLRLLYLKADRLSPAMVEALNAMPQLQVLEFAAHGVSEHPTARECLAAIARMSDLD